MRLIAALLMFSLGLSGCATHTETGAAAGGLLGAATGALIGSRGGDAAAGALIGGGVGALTGGLIGASADQEERREAARFAAATAPGPMTVNDVIAMTQSNVKDDTIITQIITTRSIFQLTPQDVINLKNLGVSERVIQVMLESNRRPMYPARTMVVQEPSSVIYVERCPPPPIHVGFGYSMMRVRHY